MPDIFLSYSRDDSLVMGQIRDNLRKLGFNLWIDIEHLKPGTPQWVRAVRRAIGNTDGMIVLCSPPAERSEWVNREIHEAKALLRSGEGQMQVIIPVLISGTEISALPFELVGDQYCDMRGRFEPERGFRELVARLAVTFNFDVPDYCFEAGGGMQLPSIQIINVQGHVEGHVIAIGRDVAGDVDVAGGDISRRLPAESSSAPRPYAPPHRGVPAWLWIGGAVIGMAVLLAVIVIDLRGLPGMFGGGVGKTLEPTQQVAESARATPTMQPSAIPTNEPTVTSPLTPTLTAAGEQARALAAAGVTRNDDWIPYTEQINGVLMALVPKGCFQMGSESGYNIERPVHDVCFTKPFWIDVYEVTQAQFAQFSGEARGANCFTGENLPQVCITWTEADAFCRKRGVRLPTEAEWEYAARGPDGLVYPWGNEFVPGNIVYHGNSENHTWNVGSKPGGVSWVGAYDLSGNVWEWVNDWYSATYYGTLTDGVVNPQGPDSGDSHVLRGGSWSYYDRRVRAADRYWGSYMSSDGGFRCGDAVPVLP